MKLERIALISIIILSFILRFYRLGSIPASLNADEAAIGYNAFSILKTGRDEYGQKFPLAFRSFDDYKAPLYIYLTVPSIAVFGLNNFAVRLPSAMLGVLTVVFTYFFVKELFRYELRVTGYPSIVSSFFLAISPWHIHFSRSAYEANASVFFIVAGMFLLLRGLKNGLFFILGGIILLLSLWTYHAPRIFIPLLLIGLVLVYFKEIWNKKQYVILSILISAVLLIPIISIMISPEGQVRAKGVSSLGNPIIIDRSIRWRETDARFPFFPSNIVHNRRIEYAKVLLSGYLSHFDPAFLFLEKAEQKYRVPGMGLMYIWELPLLLLGFYYLMRYGGKGALLIFWWILMAPVAASPTERLPHPVRTIVFLPALQVLAAAGIGASIIWLKKQKIILRYFVYGIGSVIVLFSLGYYIHQYFVHLPIDYASDWQYGRKEVVEATTKYATKYDRIVVSMSLDQPQIFFLYYLQYDPQKYLNIGGTVSGKFDVEDNSFDIYTFRTIGKYHKDDNQKVLYVGLLSEVIPGANILETIHYPNGQPAFVLFE